VHVGADLQGRLAEVALDEVDERGRLAPPVDRAARVKDRLLAERLGPAPVARLPAEAGIARDPAAAAADAVDARAATTP